MMATSNEDKQIKVWHDDRLVELGVESYDDFQTLAKADWHELERLKRNGCPLNLAIRILAPLTKEEG